MRRARDANEDNLLFTSIPIDRLEPTLARHLGSVTAQSARFNEVLGQYSFTKAGGTRQCGGLVQTLKWKYYPKYEDNRSKRKWKTTKIKGSSAAQGKKVDTQVAAAVEGRLPARVHPMTRALLDYWREEGHQLQAAQVPVELTDGWLKLTQADLITLHTATGKLWLWEIKSGAPVGFATKQGYFTGILSKVPATKSNIWQLQLLYTRLALESAGVAISEARVIQIHETRGEEVFTIKVYSQPEWTALIKPMSPAE